MESFLRIGGLHQQKTYSPPLFIQEDDRLWIESSIEINKIRLEKNFPGCELDNTSTLAHTLDEIINT